MRSRKPYGGKLDKRVGEDYILLLKTMKEDLRHNCLWYRIWSHACCIAKPQLPTHRLPNQTQSKKI